MLIIDRLADKEKYKEENKITLNPGLMKSLGVLSLAGGETEEGAEARGDQTRVLEGALAAGEPRAAGKIRDVRWSAGRLWQ